MFTLDRPSLILERTASSRAYMSSRQALETRDDGDISLASSHLIHQHLRSTPSSSAAASSSTPTPSYRPRHLRRASSLTSKPDVLAPLPSAAAGSSAGPAYPLGHRKRKSTLTRANELPTSILTDDLLARLHRWIQAIVVVNFDLDRGPEFDNCYPPTAFSAAERNSIAFSSFPDHNEKGESNITFSWRIPRLRDDGITPTDEILHGYCYFRQDRSDTIRRGYAQRSIAIITNLDGYPGLFSRLISILGPMYCSSRLSASAIVETAIMNICKWPAPQPGTIELGFLNHIFLVDFPVAGQAQFRIPQSSSLRSLSSLSESSTSNPAYTGTPLKGIPMRRNVKELPHPPLSPGSISLLASQPATSLSELLRETIDQLWLIWELVILAEPILVYSTDQRLCSEVVRWLVTIIRPLPFSGDYRPFFHIHTPDFAILLNNIKPKPGVLLGATNPLILSGARHFPHILRISPASNPDTPVHGVFGSLSKSAASKSFKEAQTSKHGLFSERKRHVKKDRDALALALDKMRNGDFAGADTILVRTLSAATERFLVPLNRYFATLLPADTSGEMSTPKQTQAFNQAHFLQSLRTHGTPLEFRRGSMPKMSVHSSTDSSATSTAINFYERFLRSPNFLSWIRDRSDTMHSTNRERYLKRLQNDDPSTWLKGKGEAEMSAILQKLETEVRITDQELQRTPLARRSEPLDALAPAERERAASYDDMMHTGTADRHVDDGGGGGGIAEQEEGSQIKSTSVQAQTPPSPPSPLTNAAKEELRTRSVKLRAQMARVKAIHQAMMMESSEDSDVSSRDH